MKDRAIYGVALLAELAQRLRLITPDQFRAPVETRPANTRVLGVASDYQKALVTLRDQVLAEHENFHNENGMKVGGNSHLPFEHEFLHAAHQILDVLLIGTSPTPSRSSLLHSSTTSVLNGKFALSESLVLPDLASADLLLEPPVADTASCLGEAVFYLSIQNC